MDIQWLGQLRRSIERIVEFPEDRRPFFRLDILVPQTPTTKKGFPNRPLKMFLAAPIYSTKANVIPALKVTPNPRGVMTNRAPAAVTKVSVLLSLQKSTIVEKIDHKARRKPHNEIEPSTSGLV